MELSNVFVGISAVGIWATIQHWFNLLSKRVEPVIAEIEKRSKDGIIDRKDRKAIAMKTLAQLEAQKIIKLNFLSRFFISIVVDKIAKKMPNFNVSAEASKAIDDVVN